MELHAVVDLVVFSCAVVICCFGNILVIISVRRFEYLKESAFYFVALLAFYDFCHGAPLLLVSATLSTLDSALVDFNYCISSIVPDSRIPGRICNTGGYAEYSDHIY